MLLAAALIALAPCGPPSAETLAQTRQVRVFDAAGTVRVCTRESRGATRIGPRDALLRIRASGAVAAWLIRRHGVVHLGTTDWPADLGPGIDARTLGIAGSTVAYRRGDVIEVERFLDHETPPGRLLPGLTVDRAGRIRAGSHRLGPAGLPCVSSSGCAGIDGIAVAGRYAAARHNAFDRYDSSGRVVVHGFGRRTTCRSADARVGAFVLTRGGAVACLVEQADGVREVRAEGERLDRGPGIDPDSLRRAAGRLVWTHDGVQRSAPLPQNPERLVEITGEPLSVDGRFVLLGRLIGRSERTTSLLDEETGTETALVDGCPGVAVGGGRLLRSCYEYPGRPLLQDLATGAPIPIAGLDPARRLSFEDVGARWLRGTELLGIPGRPHGRLLDPAGGRLIPLPTRGHPRRVVDLDTPGGYAELCAPLRRSFSLIYEHPYAVIGGRGDRIVLHRCGRRPRVLCRAHCRAAALAGGVVAVARRRLVTARDLRTGGMRTWRVPVAGDCHGLDVSSVHVYRTCDRATYRGRLPGR